MKRSILIFIFAVFTSMAWGQLALTPKVIASSGKSYKWGNYDVSYTIGEMAAVSTIGSTSGLHLTQGFHQEEEMTVGIADNIKESNLNFVVYPNPAANTVSVSYEMTEKGNVSLTLTDINGKIVAVLNKAEYAHGRNAEHYDLSNIASGNYMLTLQFTSISGTSYFSTQKFTLTH